MIPSFCVGFARRSKRNRIAIPVVTLSLMVHTINAEFTITACKEGTPKLFLIILDTVDTDDTDNWLL